MSRLYKALLALYPASFRREYRHEMLAVFAERAARAGPLARVGLLLEAVAGELPNALAAHWEILRQDLRYTARTLRRSFGFALAAVCVTALGVGANTAAFSVADFVLFRPLPYPESDEIVGFCEGPRTGGGWGCMNELSPANYRDLKALTTSFSAAGAFNGTAMNLVGGGDPQRVDVVLVTPEVFPLLGVPPALGRWLDSTTAGADSRVVVLSHGLWQTRFGGDPGVLGRAVSLDGEPYEIIGVMPSTFDFPVRGTRVWTHLELREEDFADRENSYLVGIGRLTDGPTCRRRRCYRR